MLEKLYARKKDAYNVMKDLQTRAENEKRELTGDEETQWQKANEDYDAAVKEIETFQRSEERTSRLDAMRTELEKSEYDFVPKTQDRSSNDDKKRTYGDAFNLWFRWGFGGLSPEDRSLMGRNSARLQFRGTDTQAVGADEHGGYLVPDSWANELIKTMAAYGGMLEVCRVLNTSTGQKLYVPTVPFAGGGAAATEKGAIIAEGAADAVSDITYAEKQLDAYLYTSKLMLITYELIQDNEYDAIGHIREVAADRLYRIANEHFTTGTGTGQPNGVVTATSAGKTAAANNAITADELVDLEHSVDPAYRRGGSVRFMFNDSTLAALKKLSFGTSDDRPLWVPSVRQGEPDTLLGYQYSINQDMAAIGSNAKSALFGDFSKYWIRQAKGVELVRTDERYVELRKVGFFAYARWDGELVDANAIKHLLHPA